MKRKISSFVLVTSLATAGLAQAGFDDMLKQGSQMLGGAMKGSPSTSAASTLPTSEIDAGLKQALEIGADRAVAYLGKPGGFLDNPKVRIGLPGSLDTVAKGLRAAGQGAIVDEFEETVNRAAEAAIPKTLDIVKETITGMTLDDARQILSGGDDAATRYLRQKAGASLEKAVKPIVSEATEKAGATAAYKKMVGGAGGGMLGGLLGGSSLDLDSYVTEKTLDGLFTMLAEEEKKIRTDPLARSTDLLKSVFGK